MNDYVCWSAPVDDLSDWRYEGVIYRKKQDPKNRLGLYQMFAPDVTRGMDGRYYLYYTLGFLGIMAVAVCDTPNGKFKFYGYVCLPNGDLLWNKKGDPYLFDPGVIVDDDGKVYLYSGFAPKKGVPSLLTGFKKRTFKGGYVIELRADMKTVISEPKLMFPKTNEAEGTGFEGHEFFEASSIRKIEDTYYFIYSSINGHDLCYATSESPTGRFKYGGTIISNGDLYIDERTKDEDALNYIGNNHGSIVCVKGQWFVFYHRQTNRHHFSRQALAEPIEIKENGTISQVEMTSCGLNNAPLRGTGKYEARIACHLMSMKGAGRYGTYFGNITFKGHPYFTQTGKDRENNPTQYIANMRDGAVAGYKYFMMNNLQKIAIQVKATGKGEMLISTTLHGEAIARIPVKQCINYNFFHTKLNMENGKQALYFTYKGSGKIDFKSFILT